MNIINGGQHADNKIDIQAGRQKRFEQNPLKKQQFSNKNVL